LAMLCGTDLHNQGYTLTTVRNSYFWYSFTYLIKYRAVTTYQAWISSC
jgi:hypothetical protein